MSNPKDIFVEFLAGATVYKEGDAGGEMYVIESGQVDVLHPAGNGEVAASFGPGDFFGEAGVIEDGPRSATALAKERTRLLRIERAAFGDVLRTNVEIGVRIMRRILQRERATEQRLRDALSGAARPAARADAQRPAAPAPAPAAPAPAPAPASAPAAARPAPAPAPAPAAPPVAAPAPAPAAAKALLLRAPSGETIALDPARNEYLIGRPDPASGSTPEINLGPLDANRTLSRRHAKIVREGAAYFLREESASNGTFVNGERLQPGVNVPVKAGDKLRFGMIEVELANA